MTTVHVGLGQRGYDVHVGPGILDQLEDFWTRYDLGTTAAVVSDKTVEKHHGKRTLECLQSAGVNAQLIPIPPGESSKSWQWTDRLYTRLAWANFDRRATIVALGGGVVGDLAGFVAATYMRGIDWVAIPTTLLAQVDAAIGGKTGINHRLGKNLIGAFHQPRLVVADPDLLRTLPERQFVNGFAEVVKYGLISDAGLLQQTEDLLRNGDLRDLDALGPLIERSIAIKSDIVTRDERETGGERATLNFGHTLGHALEAATHYQTFLHGEAVVWGMRGEVQISRKKGLLSGEQLERVRRLLGQIDVPPWPNDLDIDEMIAYVRRDKKARSGRINVVLLQGLGQARLSEVDEEDVRDTLNHFARQTTTDDAA